MYFVKGINLDMMGVASAIPKNISSLFVPLFVRCVVLGNG